MPDSSRLVRLPIAVFTLAFRKSMRTLRSGYVLSVAPCRLSYLFNLHLGSEPYMYSDPVRISPVKSCRRWRHFSPQIRFNRFVFLNLPVFSLEMHLGVTTSPHIPFPTGFVTLLRSNRSPPLRLMLSHSRKPSSRCFLPGTI